MEILLRQPYSFCQRGERANQEDARFPDCDAPQGCKPAFVVCDGVGGQAKGEVASRTVADAIGTYMEGVDLTKDFTPEDFSKVLSHAYSALHRKMQGDTREMATTMTFVCFSAAGAFCAHIGDSRIYHVRPGVGIMYRSEDHSLVNALVHSGNLTPEGAINHPNSNIITRCMAYVDKGADAPAATAMQIEDVEGGDYFFLCTDGVLHCVEDSELLAILSSDRTDKEKIDLIAEKSRHSSDNNTAYLIGVEEVISDQSQSVMGESATDDGTGMTGVPTAPLDRACAQAAEVKAATASAGTKIANFFKGLFR